MEPRQMTGAEMVLQALIDHGVKDVFGYPGGAVLPIYDVLFEQEAIIGRRKESGAPFGMRRETDLPEFAGDPDGKITPLDAHIRLANPRTAEAMKARILRRGFSYARGFDGAGQLDQGLAFVSYQRRLQQFLDIQARLAGEPLEEYTQVDGGGFYFALPGVQGRDDWLGRSLIAGL